MMASQVAHHAPVLCRIEDGVGRPLTLREKRGSFKRLVEEACPIAYFGKHVEAFKSVPIVLRIGSQPFDAEMVINGTAEYIEVVNSLDGHINHLSAKMLNQNGMSFGTTNKSPEQLKEILNSGKVYVGDTVNLDAELERETARLVTEIDRKISHGYRGTYHLVAVVQLDLGAEGIETIVNPLKSRFASQTAFKTITLFEARDAQCRGIFPG